MISLFPCCTLKAHLYTEANVRLVVFLRCVPRGGHGCPWGRAGGPVRARGGLHSAVHRQIQARCGLHGSEVVQGENKTHFQVFSGRDVAELHVRLSLAGLFQSAKLLLSVIWTMRPTDSIKSKSTHSAVSYCYIIYYYSVFITNECINVVVQCGAD